MSLLYLKLSTKESKLALFLEQNALKKNKLILNVFQRPDNLTCIPHASDILQNNIFVLSFGFILLIYPVFIALCQPNVVPMNKPFIEVI